MKLYYSKGACSLVPRIVINELGLNSNFEAVDLKTKKTEKNTDFLTINPKGAVPTLETDDKQILTENAVILQYLADKNNAKKLLPPVGDFNRNRVLEWTNYATTELHKTMGSLFNPNMPQEIKDNVIIPLVKQKLNYVNQYLKNNKTKFLLGNDFTIADAYMTIMLFWLGNFKIDIKDWSELARYFSDAKKRDAVAQSFSDEGF